MRESRTLQRLITLVSAPIIWMLHFVTCYVIIALVCALQLTDSRVMGLDPGKFGVATATVIAAVLMAWIAVTNIRKWRDPPGPDPEMNRFFAVNTLLLCAISLLALAWVAFPAAVLPTCAG